ncbi:MAG TPA: hypothetical protein VHC42_10375 [Rhizomicrobium sp.]|nr:hypothetical protein [Rhizomicrobium sp.]
MKPDPTRILDRSADLLAGRIAGQLPTAHLAGTASLIALLMKFAARELESGAEIRHAENAQMRALFGDIAQTARDGDLRERLGAAAAEQQMSLTLSALDEANAALKRLLIDLHVHVEEAGDRKAQRRILELLSRMASRRAVSIF